MIIFGSGQQKKSGI